MAATSGDSFKKGSIELVLLTLLRERDMYGYEMTQAIKERSNDMVSVSEGSLYVTLYRLMNDGDITDRREIIGKRMRIYYSITEQGKEKVGVLREEYERMAKGIKNFLKESDKLVQ